ncbi:lytic transglycosylase domain-containing protein [Methylomicrobium sp. RS1]|uniref:lytic transglycosylase domain-containing protein n=1 Tax=Candidatus Methylomicrobium oryzae TaxID=2802053 RepID=UPI001F2E01C9|nr:lytic transglycosylase domain-containing protein [Methylomicrobium sp. RS1]
MRKKLIKIPIVASLFVFCSAALADLTINIDGQEFHSDQNGYSEIRSENMPGNGAVNLSARAYRPKLIRKERPKARFRMADPVPVRNGRIANNKNKKEFEPLIAKAADKHHVDPKLLHAVIQAESAYNPSAVSSADAVGLMQLMPGTAARFGVVDRYDPVQNIEGGTRYLKHLLNLFNSDLRLAVAAYNAGENAVMRNHYDIPPYAETRHYVSEVLSLHQHPELIGKMAKRGSGWSGIQILEWNESYWSR